MLLLNTYKWQTLEKNINTKLYREQKTVEEQDKTTQIENICQALMSLPYMTLSVQSLIETQDTCQTRTGSKNAVSGLIIKR